MGISKSTSNLALSQEAIDILISKRRGEVAELAFMHKVISMGFRVAKPWGDSDPSISSSVTRGCSGVCR